MKLPAVFGKYYLLEKIATGGMAEVFLAKSFGAAGFERLLVIKKILPHLSESKEFITMFIDEARIAATLSHSNIVQITELGQEKDDYYIAMEFVHGKDLGKVFSRLEKKGQKMPLGLAAYIITQVCEALDYAHHKKDADGESMNIIHRDVSPSNVLISYDGDVKLIDFGVARARNRLQQTDSGSFKGKLGYLAPETVLGQPVDHRSDIFATGVLLYELVTGRRLFGSDGEIGTLEKIRRCEIAPPSRHNPDLPPELEKTVLKALAMNPDERYQWAADLAEQLSPFLVENGNLVSSKQLARFMQESFAGEKAEEEKRLALYNRRGYPWVDRALEEKQKLGGNVIEPAAEETNRRQAEPKPVVPPIASRPRLKTYKPGREEEEPSPQRPEVLRLGESPPPVELPGWRKTLKALTPFIAGFAVALMAAALAFFILYFPKPLERHQTPLPAEMGGLKASEPSSEKTATEVSTLALQAGEVFIKSKEQDLFIDLSTETDKTSQQAPAPPENASPQTEPRSEPATTTSTEKAPLQREKTVAEAPPVEPQDKEGASLIIESEPAGALVLLNGKESGVTPITIEALDEKLAYFVVLRAPGYKPFVKGVKFDGKNEIKIQARLVPENAPAEQTPSKASEVGNEENTPQSDQVAGAEKKTTAQPVASSNTKGYLAVNSDPWAKVIIDGRDTGLWTPVPPSNKIELSPGRHRLRLESRDGRVLEKDIEIRSGELLKLIERIE